MDSRQPLHQDQPTTNLKPTFVRSDSSERRKMMDHYAKQGHSHPTQESNSHHQQQYQMSGPQGIPPQQPYMYNPQQYQQQQQMMMQQYQYQMWMMQQYQQQQQQQLTGQSFYPPQPSQHQSEAPSTTQKQWPNQVPILRQPGQQMQQTFPQSSENASLNFQIATGEETDSIFEQAALGQKYDDQESLSSDEDAYGEEDQDADENEEDGQEAMPIDHTLQPQKLPLETIMEENSVLHLQKQVVVEKPKKVSKSKKVTILEKPIPIKNESKPPKMKHKYPEMSENERKLAEADAYLRKLNQKPKPVQNDTNHELSQMSSWTGESMFNIKSNEAQPKHPAQLYKASLPDKERLLEDILVLRQTKNVNEEQLRLLKVSCARLRKHCDKLQDQIYTQQFESQPDWVKYKEPQQHLLQVNDLETAMEEIRRLKRENNELVEQRQFYKVNSDKYQSRAIYMRKKFTQAKESSKVKDPDSQLRLQNSQLKQQVKAKLAEVDQLKRDVGELKSKANSHQQSSMKYRQELTVANGQQQKLMRKLLKLETDKKKRAKLEELKRHIEDTMRQDDAQRDQDKEVILQQAKKAKGRSDQIEQLEEFGEFLTPVDSEEELILHQSDVSDCDKADTGSAQDEIVIQTKDYVAATLNAWNNCPGIVKKQMDKQASEIDELSTQVKELNLKLVQRRTDFERQHQTQMKQDLMKHKEKIEAIYKEKLDEEKRKLLKGKVDEVDRLIKENKRLNQQIQSKW